MEQQEEKVSGTSAAEAEAEAARRREEAIRKVEDMLAQNRANIDQREINEFNTKSWAATLKRMNMPAPRDPGMELLESCKPEKPLAEMTEDEAEATRKKAEAVARVAAMMQQQQADNERIYGKLDRKRMRNRLRFRRPQERENSVDIHSILRQYKLSPEAQERFEQMRYGKLHGVVRPPLFARIAGFISPVILLLLAKALDAVPHDPGMQIILRLLALVCIPLILYFNTWKLEYDTEADMVTFYSLLKGKNLFTMQDLMCYTISKVPDLPFPLAACCYLDPRDFMVIRLPDMSINIPQRFSVSFLLSTVELEGYQEATEFRRCLEMCMNRMADPAKTQTSAKTFAVPPETIDLAKHNAIPPVPEADTGTVKVDLAKKPAIPSVPEAKPSPAAKPEPAPKPVPKLSPEELAKAREMFAQPAPSVLGVPERSAGFPDPTKSAFPDPAQSAFPDPAQKPESDVDVDALFHQVLREHGKLK